MKNTFKVIVSGFVRNPEGKLLVIRRSADEETFPNMLAIPGGTIEVAENDDIQTAIVESALIREIREETNIRVKVLDWAESTCLVKAGKANLYLFFTCQQTNISDKVTTSEESPEAYWADLAAIHQEECTPTLKKYVREQLGKE